MVSYVFYLRVDMHEARKTKLQRKSESIILILESLSCIRAVDCSLFSTCVFSCWSWPVTTGQREPRRLSEGGLSLKVEGDFKSKCEANVNIHINKVDVKPEHLSPRSASQNSDVVFLVFNVFTRGAFHACHKMNREAT